MFGSNFDANFGIPAFPFEGADPQGGLFGANFSADATGNPQTGGMGQVTPQPAPAAPPPGTQPNPAAMLQTPMTSASPLGSPLASGSTGAPPSPGGQPQGSPAAPAAGIDSAFARRPM